MIGFTYTRAPPFLSCHLIKAPRKTNLHQRGKVVYNVKYCWSSCKQLWLENKNTFQLTYHIIISQISIKSSSYFVCIYIQPVVPILAGSSEMCAHALSEIDNLICFRHLYRSTAVANSKFALKGSVFLLTCAMRFELPSNHKPWTNLSS